MGSFEISLKNFQSISGADLEFAPGINLLVGQSNSGKTAVFRALNAVLTNPSKAKTFIKHGKGVTTVTIEYEGNSITWSRSAKESAYNINDEEYTKVGNKTLFDILPKNGFTQDDDGNIMNIEGEWDFPFPFDRTPSQLFKLFENIFCVSDSAVIIKSFKDDEARCVKEKSSCEDRLVRLNTKITALDELSKEINVEQIKKRSEDLKVLCNSYKEMNKDSASLEHCAKYEKLCFDEVNPPEKLSLDEYKELYKDISFLITEVHKRMKFVKTLPEYMEIPTSLAEYQELSKDLETLNICGAYRNMDLSKEPVEPTALEEYGTLVEDLKILDNIKAASKFTIDECPVVTNSLDEYLKLAEDLKTLRALSKEYKTLKDKYTSLGEEVEDIKGKLGKYKICPLCGHNLSEED